MSSRSLSSKRNVETNENDGSFFSQMIQTFGTSLRRPTMDETPQQMFKKPKHKLSNSI